MGKFYSKEYKKQLALFLSSDDYKQIEEVEYKRQFVAFAKDIECKKLNVFIQTENNIVAILQSPPEKIGNKSNKAEVVKFLGYDWSNRKGDEGIKYLTSKVQETETSDDDDDKDTEIVQAINSIKYIETPLYNPSDDNDVTKFSYALRKHITDSCNKFSLGVKVNGRVQPILDDTKGLLQYARLTDLIKFDRTAFNLVLKTEIEREALKVTFKWPLKVFSEIASAIETGSRPTGGVGNITSGVLSLGGEHIDNSSGFLNLSEPKYVPIEFYERADRGKLQKGDLLICKDGAMTGKVAIVRDELEGQKAMINEHVFIIRCENEITQNYLFFFLYSPFGQDLLRSNITGSAQGGLNRSNLTKINVPYPPNSIQEKVVAECQKIDAEAQDAKEKIAELKEDINEIVSGIKGKTTKLGTIAQFKNGLNYKKSTQGITINIVGVADFKENKSPDWDRVQSIKINEHIDDSFLLHKNDLVTVRSNGSRELVGRFMLIDKEPEERTTFSGFSIRVRIVSDEVNSEFLYYLLTSANIRQRLTTGSNGANIKSLNQDLLSNLEIPLPPLSEQKKVIAQIGTIESEIASLKTICNEASARKKAVLHRELIEDSEQAVELNPTENKTEPEESKIVVLPTYREGCVPLYTLRAACGYFEDGVVPEEEGWVDASGNSFTPDPKRHFAVHAKGNSMLNKIKDGDICVFEWYRGGSRNGEIVLTECNEKDIDYGGMYTIKKYQSEKVVTEEGWQHTKVELIPLNKDYETIEVDSETEYRTVGIFKCVLR